MSRRTPAPAEARDFSRQVGARIATLREAKQMSRWRLATNAGIQQIQLDRIESGESSPSLEKLFLLADALDTTPQELVSVPVE